MKKLMLYLLIFIGILLLIATFVQPIYSSLVYKFIFFCSGSFFGIIMALASFKVVELGKLKNPEKIIREYLKIMLITVILLLPIYVVPMQYFYLLDNPTLLLIYASGGLIFGGVTGIVLTRRLDNKVDIVKLEVDLKIILSRSFIMLATSITLITIGSTVIYIFSPFKEFIALGSILIFCGIVFLIYLIMKIRTVAHAII